MEKIINKSEDLVTLEKISENKYVLDYGVIEKGSNSKINLEIYLTEEVNNYKVEVSCGCTKGNINRSGNTFNVELSYDTKRPGTFGKNAYFRYNKDQVIIFNLKGVVK